MGTDEGGPACRKDAAPLDAVSAHATQHQDGRGDRHMAKKTAKGGKKKGGKKR